MATREESVHFHIYLTTFGTVATICHLSALSMYFVTHEYKDNYRSAIRRDRNEYRASKPMLIRMLLYIALFLYVTSIILYVLSLSLYKSRKGELPSNVTEMYLHVKRTEDQSSFNQPALIASISGVVLLIGSYLNWKEFESKTRWSIWGIIIMALGWLGFGITASIHRNNISSIQPIRLAWSLPSVSVYLAGLYLIPWQIQNHFVGGPAFLLMTLGLTGYTISNSYVHHPQHDT